MTEQDKKKFKTVPAMDMDEYKQKIREHRLKILKRTLVTALIVFQNINTHHIEPQRVRHMLAQFIVRHCSLISLSGFAPLRRF